MKYYPSYMPLPQVSGFSYGNSNRTITSTFESGRISNKSLATSQRDIINVTFKFNKFQLGIWESFVQTTLVNGALEFTINLFDAVEQTVTPTIVLLSEGKYKSEALSGDLVWQVSATFIKQNKVVYTQEELDDFETLYGI